MSKILAQVAAAAGLLVAEDFYLKALPALSNLYAGSGIAGVCKGYGGVILVNVIGSTLVLTMLGGKVGGARSRLREKAEKDGDEDAGTWLWCPQF
jgi:hypothetical protein